jgi:RHS repeat-associated protein
VVGPRRSRLRFWLSIAFALALVGLLASAGVARVVSPSTAAARPAPGRFLAASAHPSQVRRTGRAAVTGTITPDGTATSVTISTSGDTANVTFSETGGHYVFLDFSGPFQYYSTVQINDSTNTPIPLLSPPNQITQQNFGIGFVDKTYIPATGTYTIVLTPKFTPTTGTVTFHLWEVPADYTGTATLDGTAAPVTVTTPGQQATLTFNATGGHSIFAAFTGGLQYHSKVSLTDPNNQPVPLQESPNQLSQQDFGVGYFDRTPLPAGKSGTYTLRLAPYEGDPSMRTGTASFQLWDVPPDDAGTMYVNGAAPTMTIGTPGQRGLRTFTGLSGQVVTLTWSGNLQYYSKVSIDGPSGSQPLAPTNFQAGGTATVTLPTSGVYTIRLAPGEVDPSKRTGSATFQLTDSTVSQTPEQTFGFSHLHAVSASAFTADPVNSLTGAFTSSDTDLSEAATGVSFAFIRSYTSADGVVGRLGPGWTDNYATSLAVQPNGDVVLHGEGGEQVYFIRQPDGSFAGAAGALSTLSAIPGGYGLLTHDQVSYRFDANGVLQSELDRNGQGLTFGYDGSGRLSTVTDAAGHLMTLSYNGSNLLASVATPDQRTVSYGYTNGRLTSVTLPDPDGPGPLTAPVWTYTYEASGRLWQEIDPNNHTVVTNVYDPTSHRVTRQTDGNNKTTTFAWDPGTQTTTITDPDNHVWKDVYQNNVLVKQIDPAGDTTQLGHDLGLDTTGVTAPNGTDTTSMSYQNGNLMTATAPASLGGVQKAFSYDSQNNVKTVLDARNKQTVYGYDAAGNNNTITVDGQQTFGATYNAQGQMLTSTDGNGNQTTYTYDSAGNVASVTAPDPDGPAGPLQASKTTYTYDAMGNVLTKVDPLGNCAGCTPADYTTTYTYDTNGHLLTETDPLGQTTTHTYDAAGNETSVTDANGNKTTNLYDSANHLIQVTGPDPDGPAGPLEAPITKYSYDDAGNRITMIGPRGNCSGCNPANYTTTYAYNQNNQLLSETTPKAETTSYSYDANGNLATKVDPRGNVAGCNCASQYTTSYSYDAAGRLLTTTDPLGHVTTNHYDAVGNLDWTKDANQHQTNYSYDASGRVLTVTAPDGGLTTYSYYGDGSLHIRKDDNNHLTTYGYDNAGRLTQITAPDPDGNGPLTAPVTTYSYDLNGNRVATTDPNGNATQTTGDGTTSYSYDHADRLKTISYSDSTPAVSYGYDNAGNRTSMSDGAGTVSYGYDNLNRLTSVTRGTDAFSYGYDVAGNLTSRTYPDGTQTTYSYDEDNRLASASSGGNVTSYGYDPASDLTQTTLPAGNGYVETRSYDAAGLLTEVKNANATSTLSDYVSTLDPVGNPTQIVQTGAVNATQTYTYDQNDRITSVCFQAGTCGGSSDPYIRWTYDKVGNRLTEARDTGPNPVNTAYSYNGLDELTQTSAQTVAPYPGQAQADGAQPYWRLGESSGSSFGSSVGSYPGTWTGSPTLGVPGALGGDTDTAATLNGTSQYGTVANASGLNKTNNFSLELWLKRTKNASSQAVAGKPLTATTKSENYAIWLDTSNDARFEVGAGTKSATVTCTAHPLDTGWHHIVGTFASGALKIYYDGTLCNSTTASFTTASTNSGTFDIGRAGASSYYGGNLDELALYGTALTAAEITDHFSKGINSPTTTAYSYDNNGNETQAGSRSFSYDLANRLATTALGATTTTYGYDGDGNRLQTSTGPSASQKINYLWDTNGALPEIAIERDGNSSLLRRYVYGMRRVSMNEGGANYYYGYDMLGSVTNVTSATGATEWTDSYEPFGTLRSETQNDAGAPANPMKFVGEYLDTIGQYVLRARQYEPTTGRFLAVDPLEPNRDQPAQSRYPYAENNPVVLVDPTGQGAIAANPLATLTASNATSPVLVIPAEGGCVVANVTQRESCAFYFFTSKALSKAQSAGVVGNLWYESGRGLNPTQWAFNCSDHSWHDGNCGIGLAQWTPKARKEGLLSFAGSVSLALNFYIQLAYVWHELQTGIGPANPNALRDLRQVRGANRDSVNGATFTFMHEYENPLDLSSLEFRQQEAWKVFARNK